MIGDVGISRIEERIRLLRQMKMRREYWDRRDRRENGLRTLYCVWRTSSSREGVGEFRWKSAK